MAMVSSSGLWESAIGGGKEDDVTRFTGTAEERPLQMKVKVGI